MKLLKIKDNNGYYLIEDESYAPIDKLTKEGILWLVNRTLDADEDAEVNFDKIVDDNLQNQTHQIIYRNVLSKLSDLFDRRAEFKDRSERLFLEEYDRYNLGTDDR